MFELDYEHERRSFRISYYASSLEIPVCPTFVDPLEHLAEKTIDLLDVVENVEIVMYNEPSCHLLKVERISEENVSIMVYSHPDCEDLDWPESDELELSMRAICPLKKFVDDVLSILENRHESLPYIDEEDFSHVNYFPMKSYKKLKKMYRRIFE
ncbi:hypothetical protein [Hydrogenimonas sp.]